MTATSGKSGIAAALTLALVIGLLLATGGSGAAAKGGGVQYTGSLNYISVERNKGAEPKRRFRLRLFTSYTNQRRSSVSASFDTRRALARYHGPNRSFDEWWITRSERDGRRLLEKLVRKIRDKGHAVVHGGLRQGNEVGYSSYGCRVRGFNTLGTCRSKIVAQR